MLMAASAFRLEPGPM